MHGGDIYRNKVELDFSVNINPLGIPEGVKAAWQEILEDCGHYPDIRQEELKRAIRHMTGADESTIICANGASELFTAIVRVIEKDLKKTGKSKKVMVPVPSFTGYERAVKAGRAEMVTYPMKRENGFCLDRGIIRQMSEDIGMIVLANPNNPVGNLIEPSLLEELLRICHKRDIIVVLDECFIEFAERGGVSSFLRRAENFSNLIIVRSFTKIFAMPGLRLGYAVCSDPTLKERIKEQLPEWNVSVPAQRAGILAAAESEYLKRSRDFVKAERSYLSQALSDLGVTVYPSEVNYLLFATPYAIVDGLLERGILIRDCSDYIGLGKGYYRVAVKKREENKRLLAALGEMLCR